MEDPGSEEDDARASERSNNGLRHGIYVLQDAAHCQAREHLEHDDLDALGAEAVEEATLQVAHLEHQQIDHSEGATEEVQDAILQVDIHRCFALHRVLVGNAAGSVREGKQKGPEHAPGELGTEEGGELVDNAAHEEQHYGEPTRPADSSLENYGPKHGIPDEHRLADHSEGTKWTVPYRLEDNDVVAGVYEAGNHEPSYILEAGKHELNAFLHLHPRVHGEENHRDDKFEHFHGHHRASRVERVLASVHPRCILDG
mmetsp:Transcript_47133/g.108961  ORF Transcript_47133/g.108961 Transcript_47133/m.108961 type:complete len:257 (-) Transcript_47133:567-1337(-)